MRVFLITFGLFAIGLTAFGQVGAKQFFGKGYYMINQRNYQAAIESFLKAIELDSTGDCGTGIKDNAHGELGYAYIRSNDTTNAANYFDKSIKLNPANAFPDRTKQQCWQCKGNMTKHIKYWMS